MPDTPRQPSTAERLADILQIAADNATTPVGGQTQYLQRNVWATLCADLARVVQEQAHELAVLRRCGEPIE
jgi:hypothetical protein